MCWSHQPTHLQLARRLVPHALITLPRLNARRLERRRRRLAGSLRRRQPLRQRRLLAAQAVNLLQQQFSGGLGNAGQATACVIMVE